jgi:hypothetical protein
MSSTTLLRLTVLCAGLLVSAPSSFAQEEEKMRLLGFDWDLVTAAPAFGDRFQHRGTVMGDRMFISGGYSIYTEEMFLSDVWSSTDGAEWRCDAEDAPWSGRISHGLVALGDTLYIMGGYNGTFLSDVWKSTDGATWELVTDAAPWEPRCDFQALVHDGAIFVMGGRSPAQRHADVWSTTDGLTWTLVSDNAWPARSHFGAVSHEGSLVILGGAYFDYDLNHHFYHRDTWSSVDGREWTLLNSNIPMRRRILMEMVSVGPYIYAIGGDDKPWFAFMRRDAWVSPDGVDWMKLRQKGNIGQSKRLDYELRINHVLLAKDDAIYIIGGHQAWSGTFNTRDRFGRNSVSNVWKSTGEHHPEFVIEYGPEDEEEGED